MSDEPAAGEAESPWALVLRRRAEGASVEALVTELRQRGLEHAEVELLLTDEIAVQRREVLSAPGPLDVPTGRAPVYSQRESSPLAWAGVVGGALLLFAASCVITGSAVFPAVLGALGVSSIAAGLARLRRAPRRHTLRRTAFILGAVATPPALLGLFVAPNPWSLGWSAVWVASALGALVTLSGRRPIKSVADFEPEGTTLEHHDVQLRLNAPSPAKVAFGGVVEIIVHAQNVVRAPRDLLVGISGSTGVVNSALRHSFALRPGYVHQLVIPIRVCAVTTAPQELIITFAGAGTERGDRVQPAGGTFWSTTDTLATHLLHGAFGASPHARVMVSIDPSLEPVQVSPKFESKIVYEPTDADLERASKT